MAIQQEIQPRYLSRMSGGISGKAKPPHIAAVGSLEAVRPPKRIEVDRLDWHTLRDMYARQMPDLKPQGSTLAERLFWILTHKQYMRTGGRIKSNVRAYREEALARMQHSIDQAEPIEIVLPAFPIKCYHPLKMRGSRADMGEISALAKFHEMIEQVRRHYPPGVVIHIVSDGAHQMEAFGNTPRQVDEYTRDLRRIVKNMGLDHEFKFMDLKTELESQPDYRKALAQAEREIDAELQSEDQKPHLDAVRTSTLASLEMGHLPKKMIERIFTLPEAELTPDELLNRRILETRVGPAMRNFLIQGRTIELVNLFDRLQPNALRGSVHDGPGRITMRFHAKGTEVLPWMGVAVEENGEFGVKYFCQLRDDPTYVPVHLKGSPMPLYYKKLKLVTPN
ncbi:L-tyrosine/L-tryptophan isonitrile synthase family protein [Candidatus Micrarchaeota archaeon]|nr:L-tyrosine/L-tryptophan isonitrile synthase family protein [Candidatus Micrarchaeota archaeon]